MATFPSDVNKLNVNNLDPAQALVIADWLGVRYEMNRRNSRKLRDEFLAEAIKANPVMAQRAYDLVVHKKDPNAATSRNDMEQRYLELASSAAMAVLGDIEQKSMEYIKIHGNAATANFDRLARKALLEAAERVQPIVIKDAGKLRKVKGVLPPEFKMMVELASARIPIMLVGPAGCGKTYLCEKLAEALNLEYSDQSCSEGMSEAVFNGRLLPIGKGGAFEHVPSPFLTRYEKGGVMLLDEIDAGDPNLFTYINKAIANTSYTVEQRWSKPVVRKHSDFVLVAAANTFGNGADAMYVGRNQLDAATLDRFKVGLVTMDYSKQVEESIGTPELCEWAWKIRAKIRQNKLRRIMSTRVIKDLAAMTAMYSWGFEQWNKAYFTGWTEAERNMVLS